jgi:phospholipase/carboxylesterase
MSSGRVFRFAPTPDRPARHLFVFLHGCGATAQSMIPIAFRFQARFPSAALVVPSGFDPDARGGAAQDWYPTRGLNVDNHRERVASVLPDVEDLVRREQTNFGVTASRTVLIGFSQGGTVALELVKTPGLAGAVVAFSSRYARLPANGARISSRIHLVHGEYDSVVSRVYAERAARGLAAPAAGNLRRPPRHAALKEGIVLVAHGSRDPEWSRPFERIAASLAQKLPAASVGLAYLEHGPSLDEIVAALVAKGVASIRVVPVFLGQGSHVKDDLPRLVAQSTRPGVALRLDTAIGEQPQVIEAIAAIISAARQGG